MSTRSKPIYIYNVIYLPALSRYKVVNCIYLISIYPHASISVSLFVTSFVEQNVLNILELRCDIPPHPPPPQVCKALLLQELPGNTQSQRGMWNSYRKDTSWDSVAHKDLVSNQLSAERASACEMPAHAPTSGPCCSGSIFFFWVCLT